MPRGYRKNATTQRKWKELKRCNIYTAPKKIVMAVVSLTGVVGANWQPAEISRKHFKHLNLHLRMEWKESDWDCSQSSQYPSNYIVLLPKFKTINKNFRYMK